MQREPLGIQQMIQEGLQKPDDTAKIIARILTRDIWTDVSKHESRDHFSMSPLEQVALVALRLEGPCRKTARTQVQASFMPTIKLLLSDYELEKNDFIISAELQKMVAHAVLEIIAANIKQKGHHELAHGIHNETNALHLLKNPTRLALLDHGIIHANPREAAVSKDTSALWTGHRTNKEYNKSGTGGTNIYVEVTPEGKIIPVLEGNHIISGIADEIMVFTDDEIRFHAEPRLPVGLKDGFTAPLEFSTPNTIGTFKHIIHKSVTKFVKWNGYILRGQDKQDNQEKQIVVCIRTKEDENNESFASNGKIFTLDNTIIVIENDGFFVLSESGKEKVSSKIDSIVGIRKTESGKEAIYVLVENKKQKISIKDGTVVLNDIEAIEEEFFVSPKK